jgi:hypothetical protein
VSKVESESVILTERSEGQKSSELRLLRNFAFSQQTPLAA